ncbi:MAG: putative Ig domain-containing protein, partial [Planctomycetota bacterium]
VDLDPNNSGGNQPNFAAAWTEGDPAVTVVDTDATVSDPDNTNLASMTVSITANFVAGDTLDADVTGTSITKSYDAGVGVLTLSGSDTVANYQTVLRSLTFVSTSDDPTDVERTIGIVANDGAGDSTARTSSVAVTPVNDAPTLDLDVDNSGGASPDFAAGWTEGDPAVIIADADASIADSDDTNIELVTVTVTNFVAGDVLDADVGATGIVKAYDGAGVLTLTGPAAVADFNTVLRTVTFASTSDDPTSTARTVTFVVNDGTDDSVSRTSTVSVTPVNDAPVVSLDDDNSGGAAPDFAVTYTENDGAVTIVDADAVISDADDTDIESMTITITNAVGGDLLTATTGATNITASYDSGTGVLTLTGTDTVANYQSVLRTVSFASTSDAPTDAARTVTFVVNDGTDDSTVATATVNVQNVNDDPTITVPGAQAVDEDASLTLSSAGGNAISIGDVDAAGSDVTVTLSVTNGTLTISDSTGLTDLTGDGTATVTLTGTVSTLNTVLAAGVVYAPTGHWNGAETLTATINDGGATGSGGGGDVSDTVAITVNALNDDPTITVPVAQSLDEDGSLVFSTANGNAVSVADVDSDAGDLTVTLAVTNGTVTLADAGAVTVTGGADGTATVTFAGTVAAVNTATATITYAPTGDYNGADTLTVTVNDGGNTGAGGGGDISDTVDITVNALNDDPTVSVPGAQALDEDATLTFSDGGGNGVSIADVDAADADVTVTLAVSNGTLTLADTTGVTATGDGTASVVLTGTVANLNTALDAGFDYAPTEHYNGADTLTATVNDQGNTGSGGGGDVSDTVAITVNAVNDDPTVAVPAAQTVDEDGSLVFSSANGNAIAVADVDSDAGDLTVTLAVTHGTLALADVGAVTLIGGADGTDTVTFTGTVTAVNTAIATITYAPDADYNGADTLTLIVNDGGNTGAGGGGDISDTVDITVNAVNDAPTISVDGSLVEDTVAVDDVAEEATFTFEAANVNAITVAETDTTTTDHSLTLTVTKGTLTLGDTTGLANLTGDGTASVSFDGTIAEINTALEGLSYTGDVDAEGAETLTLTLDDNGNTGSGGAQAITRTITFTLTPVNDAPVLDNSTTMTVTGVNEDVQTIDNPGMTITDLLATGAGGDPITDVDTGAVEGVAVISIDGTNGTWQFSTDGGASWSAFGPVSNTTAVVLTATANDKIRFRPNNNFNGTATVTFRAWDTTDGNASGTPGVDTSVNGGSAAFSTATGTAQITVSGVNDAPTMDNSVLMTLTAVDEDVLDGDNAGTLVSDLLATGAGGDPIGDVDTDAVEGIAVTSADNANGAWQYSIDGGGTWTDFGSVDDFGAVVLDTAARVRFVPAADYNGTADLTFRAWDTTDGNASGTADVAVFANGGTTAYSTATAFGRITVNPVNDAPRVDAGIADQTATEDAEFTFTVAADAFAEVDAEDSLTYAATLADDSPLPAWLSFDPATRTFTGTPTNAEVGSLTVKVTATDGSDASASTTFALTVENTNDAPTVANPIADQAATEDLEFTFTVAADTFDDIDVGDTLTYAATLADDSPLPGWLSFDPATRTFSGTPANADVGTISVTVTATDGSAASISDTFDLAVANVNDAPTMADQTLTLAEDAIVGTVLGSLAATDVDAEDSLTYSIVGGTDADRFALDSATGEVTLADATGVDFETTTSYTFDVQVEDGAGATATATVTVNVTNVNEAPAAADATVYVPISAEAGDPVVAVVASDVDAGDSLTYAITGGDAEGAFAIDGATGAITVADAAALAAGAEVYTLEVTVTDEGDQTAVATITVNVADAYLEPAFTGVTLPDTVVQGNSLATQVALTNTGIARALDPVTLRYYAVPAGGGEAILLKTSENMTTGIAAGDVRTYIESIELPDNAALPAGEYTLTVEAQVGDIVTEAADDTLITVEQAVVTLTPEVTGVSLPDAVLPDATGVVSVRVTNNGNIPATAPMRLELYLSADDTYDDGDAALMSPVTLTSDLAPGASKTVNISVAVPSVDALSAGEGAYQVLAVCVSDGETTEAVAASPITVAAPFIDLTADIARTTLPAGSIVPGDRGAVVVTVSNLGNVPAVGGVIATLYASQTGDVDGTAVQLADPVAANVALAASGGAANLAFRVTVPGTLEVDTDYHLVVEVEVDPDGGMDAEGVDHLDNNVGASDPADVRTFAMRFGTYGERRNVVMRVTDPATGELVLFRMAGSGAGRVGYDDAYSIEVTGTTRASSVVVVTTGGAEVNLGDVTVPDDAGSGDDVDLAGLLAPRANLTGDLDVSGGLRRLLLNDLDGGVDQTLTIGATATPRGWDVLRMIAGNVVDTRMTSLTPIQVMVVESWTDGDDAVGLGAGVGEVPTNDAIAAPWINVLRVNDVFQADLTLQTMLGLPDGSPAARGGTELRHVRIGGQVTGADWTIETGAGNLVLGGAHQWQLNAPSAGAVIIVGDLTDSTVTLDGALDGRDFGLRRLNVFGTLGGSAVRTAGNVGVVVAGGMVDSTLFAGVNDGVTALPGAGDFTAVDPDHGQAMIRRFVINNPVLTARRGFDAEGDLFDNVRVAAGRIGRAVVRDVDTANDDNGDALLGFAADSRIDLLLWLESATGREGLFRGTDWALGGNVDDFVVRVV